MSGVISVKPSAGMFGKVFSKGYCTLGLIRARKMSVV